MSSRILTSNITASIQRFPSSSANRRRKGLSLFKELQDTKRSVVVHNLDDIPTTQKSVSRRSKNHLLNLVLGSKLPGLLLLVILVMVDLAAALQLHPKHHFQQQRVKSNNYRDGTLLEFKPSGTFSSFGRPPWFGGHQQKTNDAATSIQKLSSRGNARECNPRTFLVPSQVRLLAQKDSSKEDIPMSANHTKATDINTKKADQTAESSSPSTTLAEESEYLQPRKSNPNQKRRRRRKQKISNVKAGLDPLHRIAKTDGGRRKSKTIQITQTSSSKQRTKNKTHLFQSNGSLPDVYWRSIPMEHIRQHPNFIPLPPSDTMAQSKLQSLEDIRQFRQDSWQWDRVHHGRCTTSQAVAALGFLEPLAGRRLGVSKSWCRGGSGHGAYHRLSQTPLRTLEEMNQVLCSPSNIDSDNETDNGPSSRNQRRSVGNVHESPGSEVREQEGDSPKTEDIWTINNNSLSPTDFATTTTAPTTDHNSRQSLFAAKYMVPITREMLQQRRQLSVQYSQSPSFDFEVRMTWGTAQEATSLLTAINYFWQQDRRIRIQEVGMCGAGLNLADWVATNNNNSTTSTGRKDHFDDTPAAVAAALEGLLVGASPDALICYPDGSVEALEVKNHCPFYPTSSLRRSSDGTIIAMHRFCVRGNPTFALAGSASATLLPSWVGKDLILPQYIPQLMMEMMCVGSHCRSAIFLRQTATMGALIVRIHRDDEWIQEMLYWLSRFHTDYVLPEILPPDNFFWPPSLASPQPMPNEKFSELLLEDQERYVRFVDWTKEIQVSRTEIVAFIPQKQIQRAMAEKAEMMNLFLDQ